jgi:ABC-type sugar transport system ATPase subunit
MSAQLLVELRGVSKQFSGVQALAGVDLAVERGEIHALVGENGAGKSTLGKIIGGILRPDAGEVLVEGRGVHYTSPRGALADGITAIQQEVTLLPRRSVIENVFLAQESSRFGVVDAHGQRARFAELTGRLRFTLDPDAKVATLPLADQLKVEIMRAVARRARLIVIDEPTAALTTDETALLLEIVRDLRAQGTSVVYVSHFLEEVLALADRVTVLRDGQVIRTALAAAETVEKLVVSMLGRPMTMAFPPKQPPEPSAPVRLSVRGLTREPAVRDVSFDVRAGEIVALAGLVGSGRSEVARAIFGADHARSGTIAVDGEEVTIGSPRAAVRAGIALVPESRKDQGLLMQLSVRENTTLAHLHDVSRRGVVNRRHENAQTIALLTRLAVTPRHPGRRVNTLSGGNQQKVLFGKWLLRPPKVLIVDEPTRGVDVRAKRAVHELLVDLARAGMAVLMISSEIEEVLGVAHRVLVMRLGRIVGELTDASATEEAVMHAAFGSQLEGAVAPARGSA